METIQSYAFHRTNDTSQVVVAVVAVGQPRGNGIEASEMNSKRRNKISNRSRISKGVEKDDAATQCSRETVDAETQHLQNTVNAETPHLPEKVQGETQYSLLESNN